jgi:hypothetical protein
MIRSFQRRRHRRGGVKRDSNSSAQVWHRQHALGALPVTWRCTAAGPPIRRRQPSSRTHWSTTRCPARRRTHSRPAGHTTNTRARSVEIARTGAACARRAFERAGPALVRRHMATNAGALPRSGDGIVVGWSRPKHRAAQVVGTRGDTPFFFGTTLLPATSSSGHRHPAQPEGWPQRCSGRGISARARSRHPVWSEDGERDRTRRRSAAGRNLHAASRPTTDPRLRRLVTGTMSTLSDLHFVEMAPRARYPRCDDARRHGRTRHAWTSGPTLVASSAGE